MKEYVTSFLNRLRNASEGRSGAGRISASLSGFCGFPLSSSLI